MNIPDDENLENLLADMIDDDPLKMAEVFLAEAVFQANQHPWFWKNPSPLGKYFQECVDLLEERGMLEDELD